MQGRKIADFVKRTERHFLPAMQNQHLIAQSLDEHEEMRRKQKRRAGGSAAANGFLDVSNSARIKTSERFIENYDPRFSKEGTSQ